MPLVDAEGRSGQPGCLAETGPAEVKRGQAACTFPRYMHPGGQLCSAIASIPIWTTFVETVQRMPTASNAPSTAATLRAS